MILERVGLGKFFSLSRFYNSKCQGTKKQGERTRGGGHSTSSLLSSMCLSTHTCPPNHHQHGLPLCKVGANSQHFILLHPYVKRAWSQWSFVKVKAIKYTVGLPKGAGWLLVPTVPCQLLSLGLLSRGQRTPRALFRSAALWWHRTEGNSPCSDGLRGCLTRYCKGKTGQVVRI